MASFANTLNWSISRADTFSYCKRKYYLSYYESWDGWLATATARKKLAYFLKKRQFMVTWAGEVVHNAIKYSIENINNVDRNFILSSLKKRLTRDFNNSLLFTKETVKPKDLWLYEHYKTQPVDLEVNIEKGELCLNNFFDSYFYEEIKIAKQTNSILYLDDGDINKMLFLMDSTPIYAIPDLCYKKPDGSYSIVDWKTGKTKDEDLTLQLKMYALRLQYVDKIVILEHDVNAFAYYLPSNEIRGRKVEQDDITYINEYASTSFSEMKGMLTDIEKNSPIDEASFPITEHINKCGSCAFFEICHGYGN